jgi:hypothetical protein
MDTGGIVFQRGIKTPGSPVKLCFNAWWAAPVFNTILVVVHITSNAKKLNDPRSSKP